MEFYIFHILAFFSLAVAGINAVSSPELYWQSALPNSPMPKAIKEILQTDFLEDKSTSVDVGKGGVDVDAGQGKPGETTVGVGKGGVNVDAGQGKPGGGTNVGVGKGGVNVHTNPKGKPVYVGVKPGPNPFVYNYAATETQVRDDPNVALFFLEKDLHPAKAMKLKFTKSSNSATFLPRQDAKLIPFSSNKLPQIFSEFSVKPGSTEAEIIKNTIKECEQKGIKGEEKYCATSLESMIDFSKSKLGDNIQATSTEVAKETKSQEFHLKGVKKLGKDGFVICHKQNYPYAVFYCHKTHSTMVYMVPLVGEDGTKAKAVAVCHKDTLGWNPKHIAFQVLKVKPGTVPICHFLPEDHVVWFTASKN